MLEISALKMSTIYFGCDSAWASLWLISLVKMKLLSQSCKDNG